MQNGVIERFNRSYREAVLDMFVFQSLSEVREQTELWLKEYNEERPHKSLGHLTPREYLLTKTIRTSTYAPSDRQGIASSGFVSTPTAIVLAPTFRSGQ